MPGLRVEYNTSGTPGVQKGFGLQAYAPDKTTRSSSSCKILVSLITRISQNFHHGDLSRSSRVTLSSDAENQRLISRQIGQQRLDTAITVTKRIDLSTWTSTKRTAPMRGKKILVLNLRAKKSKTMQIEMQGRKKEECVCVCVCVCVCAFHMMTSFLSLWFIRIRWREAPQDEIPQTSCGVKYVMGATEVATLCSGCFPFQLLHGRREEFTYNKVTRKENLSVHLER